MVYPQTESTLVQPKNPKVNQTSTALSTNIIIRVAGVPVGAIKDIQINETREVAKIYEVGTDGTIDSVPKSPVTYDVSGNRVRFDRLRLAQAFGRDFIHVSSQRYPFDIEIVDKQSKDESNQILTVLKNCWFTKIGYQYQSQDWVISESFTCSVEFIYSTLISNGAPVADGQTNRFIPTINDIVEKDADSGKRRGAMDYPGLIDWGASEDLF